MQTLAPVGTLLILLGGCGGTEDLCAAAARHIEQCTGGTVEAPETCVPDRASFVLGIPCSELAEARAAFFGFQDPWSEDPFGEGMMGFLGGEDPWASWDTDGTLYSKGKQRSEEELERLLEVWTLEWWGYKS